MSNTTCRHKWRSLYQKPTDPDFLKVYEATKLGRLYECQECGAIAKERSNGKISPLPYRYWAGHLTRSRKWAENLKTFAISQGYES